MKTVLSLFLYFLGYNFGLYAQEEKDKILSSSFFIGKRYYAGLTPSISCGIKQIDKGWIGGGLNYVWMSDVFDVIHLQASLDYNPWYNIGGVSLTHRYGWTLISGGIQHRYLNNFSGETAYIFSPQIFVGWDGRGICLNYNMTTNKYYKTIICPVSVDIMWSFILRTKEERDIHRKIRKAGGAIILAPKKE